MLSSMSDEDEVLHAFAKEWARWEPPRVFTPLREEDLRKGVSLPEERFRQALLRLLNSGLLASRGGIAVGRGPVSMYQFTEAGLKMALAKRYLTPEQAPPLIE